MQKSEIMGWPKPALRQLVGFSAWPVGWRRSHGAVVVVGKKTVTTWIVTQLSKKWLAVGPCSSR